MRIRSFLLAAAFAALPAAALAQSETITLRVAGWNMESGESDDNLLRGQIAEKDVVDIWGFSEVRDAGALAAFERGAEEGEDAEFDAILGTTGGGDRLAIAFDTTVLELVGSEELTTMQGGNPSHRAALVAHFKGKRTGQEFKVMVNHLARGDSTLRLEQATFLNDWARTQPVPVIALGDYNFDYHVDFGDGGSRDPGFDAMVEDEAFIWVKPGTLAKTQASDSFNTVLDFVFVANPIPGWTGKSVILTRDGDGPAAGGDFDDDSRQTDHLPIDAVFEMVVSGDADDEEEGDDAGAGDVSREDVLRRLDAIEEELGNIRALVQ
jgi:endonuclease/exonuclease/phosphatase family metal-dependent hydrolase